MSPYVFRQPMRGIKIVSLFVLFAGGAVWMAALGAPVPAALCAAVAVAFGWLLWKGGAYEYRIGPEGLHVLPWRKPARFVPLQQITSVSPWTLAGGRARVRMFRVHCTDGSLIDLPAGGRRARKRAEAAFAAQGVPSGPR